MKMMTGIVTTATTGEDGAYSFYCWRQAIRR